MAPEISSVTEYESVMVAWFGESFNHLMHRGGPVMWPLLALSVASMALVVERCVYWLVLNHPWRLARVSRMGRLLQEGDHAAAVALAQSDRTMYGSIVVALAGRGGRQLSAEQVVQDHRGRLERFLPTLSTIITAAPMLGILGTVLGIISSFEVLADQGGVADPRSVGGGIAKALVTTAFGMSIAIGVVFPYNAFRAQIERTLTRIESLVSAMGAGILPGPGNEKTSEGG